MAISIKEFLISEYSTAELIRPGYRNSLIYHATTADNEYIEHTKAELKEIEENMKFIENAFRVNNLDIKKELSIYNANQFQPQTIEAEEEMEIIETNLLSIADTIKVISYDGAYPNLCSGVLTVEINGEIERFHYCLGSRVGYERSACEKYPYQGNWVFEPKFNNYDGHSPEPDFYYFKRQAKKPMKESTRREIERIVNNYLPQRCCVGCD